MDTYWFRMRKTNSNWLGIKWIFYKTNELGIHVINEVFISNKNLWTLNFSVPVPSEYIVDFIIEKPFL